MLGRLAALEAWAAAGKLGVIRALIRDDDPAFLCGSRHGDLPDVWDDALASEVALALAASVPSADKTMRAAWELGARLPEIGALLEAGVIDAPKARLIAEVFQDLSDESAGRAEALLVPELAEPPGQDLYAGGAGRDRDRADRRPAPGRAAAQGGREARRPGADVPGAGRDRGAVGPGPADRPDAGRLRQRQRPRRSSTRTSGVFAKARMDQLRAAAYLDLLNGVTAAERIAHGLLTEQTPAGDQADTDAKADDGPAGGPGRAGTTAPAPSATAAACPTTTPPTTTDPGDETRRRPDDGPGRR